jgi:hypothetical protein
MAARIEVEQTTIQQKQGRVFHDRNESRPSGKNAGERLASMKSA